ncbi:MAG TPA: type 4a pilus biogenesis protein PilO [Gemmatimonadales bacterium]|nr:type 4a pilus biogenesis protein PilO [Gemmatimonadales bacterium]
MALMDNPRSATFLAILLAALVGYIGYTGDVLEFAGSPGVKDREERVAVLTDSVAALEASVDSAKRELARGSVEDIRKRVEEYLGTLAVLRQFVPEQNEVPNLLDDISSRAKIRGVNLAAVVPQPVQPGPVPFDTYSYEMSVIGRYDEIGRFLGDIAGLRRIIAPFEVRLVAADLTKAKALGDTTRAMLEAKFKVRTYVKSAGGADEM